jgi:rhodanese-related sulfurtransferase
MMRPWWARFGRVPEVSSRELYERVQRGEKVQILDVRTRREYRNGHIAGARNVPIQSLGQQLTGLGLDAEAPIVTICKTAHRSIPVTRLLRSHGFDAAQLHRGMDEWRRAGLPVETSE